MDLLKIIEKIEEEREKVHRVPTYPTFLELKRKVLEEMNEEFTFLLKEGKIKVVNNINGKSVKTNKII